MRDLQKEIMEDLTELPIYQYGFGETDRLLFTDRVREICRTTCARYGSSYSCPPAVGTVESCRLRCVAYPSFLFFSTVSEVNNLLNMEETLQTKGLHVEITLEVEKRLRAHGLKTYTLSSDSCSLCKNCAYPSEKCRHPEKMHPCIESHGIVVADLTEKLSMDYYLDEHTFLWFSLCFFRED